MIEIPISELFNIMLTYLFYYASHNPKGEYGFKPDKILPE